jgi:F-type H+-transporting ATPase subunit epsilon
MATAAAPRQLHCLVVTPERALLDAPADFVALPMYDGELGVLPGRAPLIGRLGYGELRIRQGTRTTHLYVDGGFVQVRSNTVTVLTSRALRANEIKPEAAEQALASASDALGKAAGPEAQEAQRLAQEKARAQLRVARHRSPEEAAQA